PCRNIAGDHLNQNPHNAAGQDPTRPTARSRKTAQMPIAKGDSLMPQNFHGGYSSHDASPYVPCMKIGSGEISR
ncbi:hypothetical protein, partial [Jannaschia rubra]|uniref:hypothetical protein n=1 Tax=Jannaschia rubra TaxID=282197 RepID=UPI002490610D